jgi:hypothetical protein
MLSLKKEKTKYSPLLLQNNKSQFLLFIRWKFFNCLEILDLPDICVFDHSLFDENGRTTTTTFPSCCRREMRSDQLFPPVDDDKV